MPEDGREPLADLEEHLLRVLQVLANPPLGSAELVGGDGPPLLAVCAVARAAVVNFAALVSGDRVIADGELQIALTRRGSGIRMVLDRPLDRASQRAAVANFIAELQIADQRMLCCAELLGLLFSLSLQWAAASFAPPVVLLSLHRSAPQILALGQKIAS